MLRSWEQGPLPHWGHFQLCVVTRGNMLPPSPSLGQQPGLGKVGVGFWKRNGPVERSQLLVLSMGALD